MCSFSPHPLSYFLFTKHKLPDVCFFWNVYSYEVVVGLRQRAACTNTSPHIMYIDRVKLLVRCLPLGCCWRVAQPPHASYMYALYLYHKRVCLHNTLAGTLLTLPRGFPAHRFFVVRRRFPPHISLGIRGTCGFGCTVATWHIANHSWARVPWMFLCSDHFGVLLFD